MKSYRTAKFKGLFQSLPSNIQATAKKTYRHWVADPRHPSLHFKSIRNDIWSIRVSLDYRAIGYVRGGAIYWHWIGPHDEYERMIRG